MKKILTSILSLSLLSAPVMAKDILDKLTVTDGFSISLFADDVENARQIAVSKRGIVYAGSRKAGNVYALIDHNSDGVADRKMVIATGLEMPSGLAIKDGDLYVAEVSRIIRFKDVDKNLKDPKYDVVYDKFPTDRHHGWKFISFAPTGELIVPVGVPCNICAEDDKYGRIFSLNVDTKEIKTRKHIPLSFPLFERFNMFFLSKNTAKFGSKYFEIASFIVFKFSSVRGL